MDARIKCELARNQSSAFLVVTATYAYLVNDVPYFHFFPRAWDYTSGPLNWMELKVIKVLTIALWTDLHPKVKNERIEGPYLPKASQK